MKLFGGAPRATADGKTLWLAGALTLCSEGTESQGGT